MVFIMSLLLGAIFDSEDIYKELAFRYAINKINQNRLLKNIVLEPIIEYVPPDNPLICAQIACKLLSIGIAGIFGPVTEENANIVQSICDNKEIPHIEARWNVNQERETCLANVYPHPKVLARIFIDIIKEKSWKGFTVLYENSTSLVRIGEILKIYDKKGYHISLRQLDENNAGNYRYV